MMFSRRVRDSPESRRWATSRARALVGIVAAELGRARAVAVAQHRFGLVGAPMQEQRVGHDRGAADEHDDERRRDEAPHAPSDGEDAIETIACGPRLIHDGRILSWPSRATRAPALSPGKSRMAPMIGRPEAAHVVEVVDVRVEGGDADGSERQPQEERQHTDGDEQRRASRRAAHRRGRRRRARAVRRARVLRDHAYKTFKTCEEDKVWMRDYAAFVGGDAFQHANARKTAINQLIGMELRRALDAKVVIRDGKVKKVPVADSLIRSYTELQASEAEPPIHEPEGSGEGAPA